MSTEGLMVSWMIDVIKGQDVETTYIPWYFLQTDYHKRDIQINMEGWMVTLLG